MQEYKHNSTSVGNNLITIQITTRNFWNKGYFYASCGSDFERAYIENQELHHY